MRFTLSPKKRMCINCMSQHSVTMYFVYTAQYIGVRVWSRQSFCIIHCLYILFRCCFYYFVAIAVAVIDAGFFSFLLCFVLFLMSSMHCVIRATSLYLFCRPMLSVSVHVYEHPSCKKDYFSTLELSHTFNYLLLNKWFASCWIPF